MADPAGSIGYSDRDLIIQTKTLVESVVGDIAEIKVEQVRLRADVDELKTARAIERAEQSASRKERSRAWTRTEKIWGVVAFFIGTAALVFGPSLAQAVFGH